MESELACIDGQLVAQAQASIPADDPGLLRGDGIFEVIRTYGGVPHALDAHLERMARSASGMRLDLDVEDFREDVAALLAARERPDVLVRLVATRGGHRVVLIETIDELPASLALEPVTYAPVRLLDGIKSLSYGANMLASRLAVEQGADEALLVTPHGRVLEAPTSSFFLVARGELRTAPLSDHVLDSITRRIVLAVATVREDPIELAALRDAQEAFLASTRHEITPVHRVGGCHYDAPGARTLELAALVRERITSELG